ncbi:MAG: DUF2339 domain-containing protein, partial [Nanoarchaeota archaeon]|nr:DUF2339 domain-containing protein [Nanoarchaeota archaeon]
MATLSSLEKEVESLKRENRHIIRRLNALEGHKPSVKASETVSQNKSPVGGILLIIFGALICFIGIGILIGIPLLVWGIIIVNKSSSKSAETMHIKAHTAKHEEPVKHIKAARKTSVESDIGIKWFSWIGILALVLGVGFFVKYAIDNGWISHLTRLVLGGVVGVGIFILGELMMKKYSRLGKVLAGGGIAILYFIIYAAYHFYDYRMATGIPLWLDITLLSIVVLIAVLFSVAKDSQAIIIEAFFLGYATSLLSNSFGVLSLVYTAMLTISLAFVVWYKKWPYIGVGGLFATYLVYRFSTAGYEFVTGFSFLTIYFVTFVILSLAMKKEGSAIPMIIGNSILYYIFSELL